MPSAAGLARSGGMPQQSRRAWVELKHDTIPCPGPPALVFQLRTGFTKAGLIALPLLWRWSAYTHVTPILSRDRGEAMASRYHHAICQHVSPG
jgi:hypothetical protein